MVEALEHSMAIINLSIDNTEKWEYDTLTLEEILRINHRGWELLLKSFRYWFSEGKYFTPGHSLVKQINKLKQDGLLTCNIQNLLHLFLSDKMQDYFKMLDNLFDNPDGRYNTLNALKGDNGNFYIVDEWIKKYVNYQQLVPPKILYENIKNEIIKVNFICIRFIALHFSMSKDQNNKQLSVVFDDKYYQYFPEEFLEN